MIDLTTDFNPGDGHGDGPYTHVKATRIDSDNPEQKQLILEVRYGTLVASVFAASTYPAKQVVVEGTDYDNFLALVTNAGETVGDAIERCLSQALLDIGAYAGMVA